MNIVIKVNKKLLQARTCFFPPVFVFIVNQAKNENMREERTTRERVCTFIYNSLKSNSVRHRRHGKATIKGLSPRLWMSRPQSHQKGSFERIERRQKICLFLYVIHMMIFCLSAAHSDRDDDEKKKNLWTYHEQEKKFSNSKSNRDRQTSCEDFFLVFIQICVCEKMWAKKFLNRLFGGKAWR